MRVISPISLSDGVSPGLGIFLARKLHLDANSDRLRQPALPALFPKSCLLTAQNQQSLLLEHNVDHADNSPPALPPALKTIPSMRLSI